MLIEVHMLKNFPATNLNRDETGAPKTCYFGGCQRGRISSQCLKRCWRMSDEFALLGSLGIRSCNIPAEVEKNLLKDGVSKEMAAAAKDKLKDILKKDEKGATGKKNAVKDSDDDNDSKDEITENEDRQFNKNEFKTQILYYSPDDLKALTEATEQEIKVCGDIESFSKAKVKEIKEIMRSMPGRALTLDIALFGRMVTSDIFLNVESAIQVAHAVSTHAVNLESDYFTAVDDLLTGQINDDGSIGGSAMIGDADYDSCCYYLYASLDMDNLRDNLKNSQEALAKAPLLVPALIRAMALSNPSGKQNTFAGNVFSDAVMVEYKEKKIPLSYVNAFAEPVNRFSESIVKESIEKLVAEVNLMEKAYRLPVTHRAWMALRSDSKPDHCQSFNNFEQLVLACGNWAKE